MSLVTAKCTQYGGNIGVDDTKEAGICKYCGTAFITEKVISNYNIRTKYACVGVFEDANQKLLKLETVLEIQYIYSWKQIVKDFTYM